MNILFIAIFIFSCSVLAITNPNAVLSSLTTGANKSVALSLSLVTVYAIWSGATEVASQAKITDNIAGLLHPLIRLLFGKTDKDTESLIALNMSANMLGMGGIATPPAIKATAIMSDSGNPDGAATLFVLAATSIQLLPTTVISLRQSYGSTAPADIFLPTLISTAISSIIGVTILKLTQICKKKI